MTYALLAGGVLLALGLWWKAVGAAVIGAGIFVVCWIGLIDETSGSRWGVSLRLLVRLPRVYMRIRRELDIIETILPLCRQYAERYPVYIRLPFVLGERHEIYIAPSDAEKNTPFSHLTVPAPVHDVATIVSRRTHVVVDPLTLLLVINREVRRLHTETLLKAVWQGTGRSLQTDFFAACLRYAIWERERSRQEGGFTLLYRDIFAESVLERFSIEELRTFCQTPRSAGVSRIVDKAVAEAWNRSVQTKRALRLEAMLQKRSTDESRSPAQETSCSEPVAMHDAATLAHLAEIDLGAAVRRLQDVFTGTESAVEQHSDGLDRGYFVAASGEQRVLFQIGLLCDGSVAKSVVAQAYTHAGLERTDQAIILALGPIHDDVLRDADKLGLLVLLWEPLDRLLAAHADRMWQAVEWSLRASRRTDATTPELPQNGTAANDENVTGVLELGLST